MRDERDARRNQLRPRRLDRDRTPPSGLSRSGCGDTRRAARDPRAPPARRRCGNRRPTASALRAGRRGPLLQQPQERRAATRAARGDRSSRRSCAQSTDSPRYRHSASNAFSSSAVSRAHSSMKFGRDTEIGCFAGFVRRLERGIVGQRRIAAHAEVVLHAPLGRQAVVVPSHRIEHGLAAHALEARDDVGVRVGEDVADVERAADGRRRRVDRVDLRSRAAVDRTVDAVAAPSAPSILPRALRARVCRELAIGC